MEKSKLEHHERTYGPHFTEECAHKAVKHMENEDGSIAINLDNESVSAICEYSKISGIKDIVFNDSKITLKLTFNNVEYNVNLQMGG